MLSTATAKELVTCIELESHYKVVHDEGGGQYSSCFIGQVCDNLGRDGWGSRYTKLQYRVSRITYDVSTESNGIHTHATYDKALEHATGDAELTIQKPTAILEVKLLKVEFGDIKAVYVVKKLWPEKVTVVEVDMAEMEKRLCGFTFKVGDYVRVKPGVSCNAKEGEVGRISGPRPSEGYHVDFPSYKDWRADNGELVLAERPAPTEKWVDVTKECKLQLDDREELFGYYGYKIMVYHGDLAALILQIGNTVDLGDTVNYRVDFESEPEFGQGGFKVLHKVITEYPV